MGKNPRRQKVTEEVVQEISGWFGSSSTKQLR
jgi:hypothetical protein